MTDHMTMLARNLRKNMTKEERKLWYQFLRTLDIPVKRQFVIGKYIVDFCMQSKGIVIELDGSQHFEEPGIQNDLERDSFLTEQGYTVLRYANNEINQNFHSVCDDILMNLNRFDKQNGEIVWKD